MKKRCEEVDALKGIGIISVVVGHAFNTDVYCDNIVNSIRAFIYCYHLALFFLAAGILFKRCSFKKAICHEIQNYKRTSIYAYLSLLFIPLWMQNNMIEMSLSMFIKRLIMIVAYYPQGGGIYVGALWFMPMFSFCILLYRAIDYMCDTLYKKEGVLLICAFLGFLLILLKNHINIIRLLCYVYHVDLVLIMLPVLGIGAIYGKQIFKAKIVQPKYFVIYAGSIGVLNYCTKMEIEISKDKFYGGGLNFIL